MSNRPPGDPGRIVMTISLKLSSRTVAHEGIRVALHALGEAIMQVKSQVPPTADDDSCFDLRNCDPDIVETIGRDGWGERRRRMPDGSLGPV